MPFLSFEFILRSDREATIDRNNPLPLIGLLLLLAGLAVCLTGCTALPMAHIRPAAIEPPKESCGQHVTLAFVGPSMKPKSTDRDIQEYGDFDEYYNAVKARLTQDLPGPLKNDKAVAALRDLIVRAYADAVLQVAHRAASQGMLETDSGTLTTQSAAVSRVRIPYRLGHRTMKTFGTKVYDSAVKPSATALNGASPNMLTFYLHTWYKGNFIDRMGNPVHGPQVSMTVTDQEITDAETVFLEFLIDEIDKKTPVMGSDDAAHVSQNTFFYPGNSNSTPTAYVYNKALYLQIMPYAGDPDTCGVTLQNVWVLRDLANGASSQAAGVGGLITGSFGGLNVGIPLINFKLSVGDSSTLSDLVKTAASDIALRATLAAGYSLLEHAKFNVPEPGT